MKQLQWYPGHMAKALRQIKEDLKLIDLVVELVDARVPLASSNPDIRQLTNGKAHLCVLNKADLADPDRTDEFLRSFREQGMYAVAVDAREKKGVTAVRSAVQDACREKRERDARRGIKNRPVRALVAGIPNIGKSTLINSLAGKKSAKTGNKPGVTKGKQWIRLSKGLELLDSPGILWPKFEDARVGFLLAATLSIRDEILPTEELALELYQEIAAHYPGRIREKYGMEEGLPAEEALQALAQARNLLKKGGESDTMRAAALFLDDFRSGKLGRISLESMAGV